MLMILDIVLSFVEHFVPFLEWVVFLRLKRVPVCSHCIYVRRSELRLRTTFRKRVSDGWNQGPPSFGCGLVDVPALVMRSGWRGATTPSSLNTIKNKIGAVFWQRRGSEGGIAQAWVNVRGGMRVFSVYFRHSQGWTPNRAELRAEVEVLSNRRRFWREMLWNCLKMTRW